jgi:hypothetical protein
MKTTDKTSRVLGFAFLLQFVTSFSSNVFLTPVWLVPGNVGETLTRIVGNPISIRATIFLDMLTALGVIFLGAMLFLALRKENEKLALTALGFYILEGALLGASKMATFSLIGLSQEFTATGQPAMLLTLANLAIDSTEFVGGTLHMLAFCLGGILFYYLLYRSRIVPVALSLWGLIATLPMLIGTITQIFGYTIPFIFYTPYVTFEFVIAIWILVKGIKE